MSKGKKVTQKYVYVTDEHFRHPIHVGVRGGEAKFVYLTSGRGFDKSIREEGHAEVDFGIYLDFGWKRRLGGSTETVFRMPEGQAVPEFAKNWDKPNSQPEAYGMYLPWPDRGIVSMDHLLPLLDFMDKEIDAGKRIEIACMGGHGRTGTLAGALIIYRNKADGRKFPTEGVIKYIRGAYCKEAIESDIQEDLLYILNGEDKPVRYKAPAKPWTPPWKGSNKPGSYSPSVGASEGQIKAWAFKDPAKRLPYDWTNTPRKEIEVAPQQNSEVQVPLIVAPAPSDPDSHYYN